MSGFVVDSKGATAGRTRYSISMQGGTATISFVNNRLNIAQGAYCGAYSNFEAIISGILKVTGSGTLVLQISGISDGSSATVSAGNGELYVARMK